MAAKPNPNSFIRRVVDVVLGRESTTAAQILSIMGKDISTTTAVHAGRRKLNNARRYQVWLKLKRKEQGKKPLLRYNKIRTTENLADMGRQTMINEVLTRALHHGLIRRISRGVYGPPLANGEPAPEPTQVQEQVTELPPGPVPEPVKSE